jgi:hypothetical protein
MNESAGNVEKKLKQDVAAKIESRLTGTDLAGDGSGVLGDFTTTRRLIPISLLAIGIGVVGAYLALGLLRLIALFTNLFFYLRWSTAA